MRGRTVLLAIGGTIALTVGGSTAYAAVAGSPVSSGVVNGCYANAEVNGSHVLVLQDTGTSCPKGTTAVKWNQTGPAGPIGPTGATGAAGAIGATGATGAAGAAGATGATGATGPAGPAGAEGPQGPPGPAGTSSLDALNGTACDTGGSNPGVLNISYGSQGSVTITCVPTQLYTLTVSVASGDGNDSILSSPAGIDCGPRVADSVCSAQFPVGYTVTLTGQADISDVLDGWTGGGCPAHVNITHPYTTIGQPGLISPPDNTCAITMSADTTVSASFAGVMLVDSNTSDDNVNFVPDPGGAECPSSQPNCKGTSLSAGAGGSPQVTDVIPYGTAVTVTDVQGNGVGFLGTACTAAAGATVTATECTFTMIPGDALYPPEASLIVQGP